MTTFEIDSTTALRISAAQLAAEFNPEQLIALVQQLQAACIHEGDLLGEQSFVLDEYKDKLEVARDLYRQMAAEIKTQAADIVGLRARIAAQDKQLAANRKRQIPA